MGKKLFVGNLPFAASEGSLSDLFARVGSVDSVKIITDRSTGRSKGFGFVEMSSDDEALTAIEKLHGEQLDGRAITVSEARPMAPRDDRRGGGGGFRPRRDEHANY